MRRIDKQLQGVIATVSATTLTGMAVDEAARIAGDIGAQLYDISSSGDPDRRTLYVWARVADGRVRRVLSVGYPNRSCSARTRGPAGSAPPTADVAHRGTRLSPTADAR